MCARAGSKYINNVLMSKRGGAHELKKGHKNAKRAKQKATFNREVRVG